MGQFCQILTPQLILIFYVLSHLLFIFIRFGLDFHPHHSVLPHRRPHHRRLHPHNHIVLIPSSSVQIYTSTDGDILYLDMALHRRRHPQHHLMPSLFHSMSPIHLSFFDYVSVNLICIRSRRRRE